MAVHTTTIFIHLRLDLLTRTTLRKSNLRLILSEYRFIYNYRLTLQIHHKSRKMSSYVNFTWNCH